MKHIRIQIIIALIVLACGVSLIGAVYRILNSPETLIAPGKVVTSSSPVAAPVQSNVPRMDYVSMPLMYRISYAMPMKNYQTPVAAMQSIGGIYTTSSAHVHAVGGGSNGGYTIATTSHNSSSKGISDNGQTIMPMTNFLTLASSRQIAQPEAQEAPLMAQMTSGPRRAPGPPNIDGPLPEDNQLVEHPLGDAMWPLLVLAMGYIAVNILYRRKRSK